MSHPDSQYRIQRVLIVDDDSGIRASLAAYLRRSGFEVLTAGGAPQALEILEEEQIQLVLTDIAMPEMSGLDLLRAINETGVDCEVIIITGYMAIAYAIEAMRAGAYDFFTKPLNFEKIVLTIQRAEERHILKEKARQLELLQKQKEFEREATMEATKSLLRAVEERDKCNIGHGRRTAEWSRLIGRELKYSRERLERLGTAALLHDIGKIGIDDKILNKPGRLTEQEFDSIKRHPEIGEYIVTPISFLRDLGKIIKHHHERWEGGGYPSGFKGEEIPEESRIICIADYFDSITSKRPYRDPMPLNEAVDLMVSQSGKIFDPRLLKLFLVHLEGTVLGGAAGS